MSAVLALSAAVSARRAKAAEAHSAPQQQRHAGQCSHAELPGDRQQGQRDHCRQQDRAGQRCHQINHQANKFRPGGRDRLPCRRGVFGGKPIQPDNRKPVRHIMLGVVKDGETQLDTDACGHGV